MKLTRKHIGQLFSGDGADGSWVYQLVDVKKGWLLFYTFTGRSYYKEQSNGHNDWEPFIPRKPWPKHWLEYGWLVATDI